MRHEQIIMKVGDLVGWYYNEDLEMDPVDNGLVVQLSKTGPYSRSALILFENGNLEWVAADGHYVIIK